VRLYTDSPNVHRLFPPKLASQLKPNFFADKNDITRTCPGARKMFSSGFGIPLWCDLDMHTHINDKNEVDGEFTFSDKKNYLTLRTEKTSVIPGSKICMEMHCPWYAQCDEDINFVATENMWTNPERPVEFLSGVADFKYQYTLNMFFYMDKKSKHTQLNSGDVPIIWKQLSERKLVIEYFYDPDRYRYLHECGRDSAFRDFRYSRVRNLLSK